MRVAVITGAAQGLGRHIARKFAQQGYALALNDYVFPRKPSRKRAVSTRLHLSCSAIFRMKPW
jgi:NAD(P)-dependent dehydrogenase (short-subunit alcohol dehydrogenase family)